MNKRTKLLPCLGFIAVVIAAPLSAAHAQTVANGGFDSPSVSGYVYRIQDTGWTFEGGDGHPGGPFIGGTGITAPHTAFTNGNPGDSTQVAFLQGRSNSHFFQTIHFDTPGTYAISFIAAQRGSGSASHAGQDHEDFNVLVNGYLVGTFQPSGPNYTAFTTRSFDVISPRPVTLEFQGIDSVGDDNAVMIDNVSITQTPDRRRRPL